MHTHQLSQSWEDQKNINHDTKFHLQLKNNNNEMHMYHTNIEQCNRLLMGLLQLVLQLHFIHRLGSIFIIIKISFQNTRFLAVSFAVCTTAAN